MSGADVFSRVEDIFGVLQIYKVVFYLEMFVTEFGWL